MLLSGGRYLIKLGDKEVEYSPDFRFYITTKLSNPHYTPEISTKTTIVNFAVKEQGTYDHVLVTIAVAVLCVWQGPRLAVTVSLTCGVWRKFGAVS